MVPKGTHQQVVAALLCRGNLWGHIKFLHLRQNMRLGHSEADNQHAQWLLEIGAGSTMDDNEMIQVPQFIVCTNLNACYESPREEGISHTLKHLISNIKLYNRIKT